jgi:O-antigen/teichoic acid export membrane protein
VVAALFLVGVQRWAPDLEILRSNGLTIVWFLFAVVSWNIFSLQDSALTGLRRAAWIPLENLTFAIAKIVLSIVFAPRFPVLGIMLSWTLPLVFLLIVTNIVLFGKFITKHIPNGKQSESLAPKKMVRFIAGDYLSTLVWIGVVECLPILILSRLNAEACAYYFLSHTIAYFFCLVSDNMGMSLVTEGAIAPENLMFNARRILVKCASIILPAALIIQISAPWILLLFGKDYAQHAPMVFRLLVLSAIPHMFISVFISTARVQKKTFEIFVVLGMLSFLLVLINYFLMDLYAIDGVGWAWLISQTIVAAVIFFTRLKPAWTGPTVVRDRGSVNSMK